MLYHVNETQNKFNDENYSNLERGANVHNVSNDIINVILVTAILPEDIALLTRKSHKTGCRKLSKARAVLGKSEDYPLSLREFCKAFPDFEPEYTAARLYILKKGI
ncbi:hypothetical protein [Chitinophaga sp.]|uniref:hypothetical protein n=1 Tax=Chitinophaga sp. TaxID=1869181 RepID=UPI0031CF992F